MQQLIYELKRYILELEKDVSTKDVDKNLDNIISICKDIKKRIEYNNKPVADIELKKINSILFMYKPITRGDYLSGNYLEQFSEERTSELKDAKAMDIHNEFWVQHEPVKGNVFGSIPKELLNEKAIKVLEKSRWKEAKVNIYEISSNEKDKRKIIKYCDENFGYFILIKEKSTSTLLILEYLI